MQVWLCCAGPCHRTLWALMLHCIHLHGRRCPGQEQKSSEASKDIKNSSCLRKLLLLEALRCGEGQPGLYILWFLTHLLLATCKSTIEGEKNVGVKKTHKQTNPKLVYLVFPAITVLVLDLLQKFLFTCYILKGYFTPLPPKYCCLNPKATTRKGCVSFIQTFYKGRQ